MCKVANGTQRYAHGYHNQENLLDALFAADASAVVQLCTCDNCKDGVNCAQNDVAFAEFAVPYRSHDSLRAEAGAPNEEVSKSREG